MSWSQVVVCSLILCAARMASAAPGVPALEVRDSTADQTAGGSASELRALAQQHFEEGERKYKVGSFEAALESYTAAYETFPVPALLFNLGQCHRQLGDHERAVFSYEGYLRESPDAYNREDVEQLIAESKAAQAESDARRERDEEVARQRAATAAAASAAEESAEAPIYEEWWFWTAIGGAAVLAAGATVITVVALSSPEQETVLPSGNIGTLDRRSLLP